MLVVTAIVVIIAGFLFAVVNQAKNAARGSHCISNMSQLGKALMLYASDAEGWSPPYVTSEHLVDAPPPAKGLVKVEAKPKEWADALKAYARSADVLYCPFDKSARTATQLLGVTGWRSSEWSSYETIPIGWQREPAGSLRVRVPGDSTTHYARDAVLCKMERSGYPNYTVHGDRVTELFTDGHAKNDSLSGT